MWDSSSHFAAQVRAHLFACLVNQQVVISLMLMMISDFSMEWFRSCYRIRVSVKHQSKVNWQIIGCQMTKSQAMCRFWSDWSVLMSGFPCDFRQSDPGLRRWQSMYNLAHESPTRWSPLSGAELRAGRSFYHTEVEQWLQDAHERLSTELDWVRPRDTRQSYNTSRTRMPDVKQKVRRGKGK